MQSKTTTTLMSWLALCEDVKPKSNALEAILFYNRRATRLGIVNHNRGQHIAATTLPVFPEVIAIDIVGDTATLTFSDDITAVEFMLCHDSLVHVSGPQ